MRRCSLIRLDYKTKHGTFGVFSIDGEMMFFTLERPFFYNRRDISCILPGEYTCRYHKGSRFNGYLLLEVPNRSGIMIHSGNSIEDITGCILLGKGLARRQLEDSRLAVSELERVMRKEEFLLNIVEYNL